MLCTFQCECKKEDCNTTNYYASDMISSQIIAGLQNTSDRSKILSEIIQLPTLASIKDRLITLESSAKAMPQFQLSNESPQLETSNVAATSQYKKFKKTPSKTVIPMKRYSGTEEVRNEVRKCRGCGRTSHMNKKFLV
jgi:hypothetical protein